MSHKGTCATAYCADDTEGPRSYIHVAVHTVIHCMQEGWGRPLFLFSETWTENNYIRGSRATREQAQGPSTISSILTSLGYT